MKLLIVDDHAPARELIRELLEPLATEIRECADGAEAVKVYDEFRPDFVTMDLQMPVLHGFEATQRILASHPRARIIAVSQTVALEIRERARHAGACHFVPKDDLTQLRGYLAYRRPIQNDLAASPDPLPTHE